MSSAAHEETVRKAQQGDLASLEVLWRANRRWVAAVLLAHRPRDVELQDLLQDVAVTLIEKIDTLENPSSFRPWLRAVAVNRSRSAGRRSETQTRLLGSRVPVESFEPGLELEDPAGDRERAREGARSELEETLRTLESLPPEYSEPLFLRSLRGLGQREIAEMMDLPETTVESRLCRARRMLRERMSRDRSTSHPK